MLASCILRQPWSFFLKGFMQLGWGLTGVRSTPTECSLNPAYYDWPSGALLPQGAAAGGRGAGGVDQDLTECSLNVP